jgi:hypothetical protein
MSYSVHRGQSSLQFSFLFVSQTPDGLLLLLRDLLVGIWAGLPPLPLPLRLPRALAMLVTIPASIVVMLVWPYSARATDSAGGPCGAGVGLGFGI